MLNSKGAKEIEKTLRNNYLCDIDLSDYFLFVTFDDKIWMASKSLLELEFNRMKRINSLGLCFGKLKKDRIHLTVEGCQLVGKTSKKNIILVDEPNMEKYIRGFDFTGEKIDCCPNNFALVKYENDFIGVSLLGDNRIENLLPKSRRIIDNR